VKVTREKTENSQAFLTIEMEPQEVEASMAESYQRLAKRANIPGFRKGKAPRAVLERYLGSDSVLEDAINQLLPQAYENAIKEQQIEAIARPEVELIQTDPVIFKAKVPLAPVVQLGDYQSVKMKSESVKVTAANINEVIEQLRHQNATWESVDRAVAYGDLAIFNMESQVDDSPFINREGVQYLVMQDSVSPAPGFAKELIGMKKEEDRSFALTLPEDYPRNEFAGKEAHFTLKMLEVKQEILPELNDEFAAQLGPEMKNMTALKEEVSKNLKLRAEAKARADFEEKVVDAVVALSQVEFPPVLVETELHRMINEQARQFEMQGANMEEYLKSINKTEEQLHEELEPVATKRITQSLILSKVAEAEKAEVSEKEIDEEIETMLKNADDKKGELQKALNSPPSRDSIRQILLTRRTVERLVEIAGGGKEKKGKPKKEGIEK
jgi:trigger factor